MYSILKHVAHTHTHTPGSPCSLGILLSLFLPCSPLSDILIHFFSLKELQRLATLPLTPLSHFPSRRPPVAARLLASCTSGPFILRHLLMGKAAPFRSGAAQNEFAKDAPREHMRALRELISPVSVLFWAAQVLFDNVLRHLGTLRFPRPDLLSAPWLQMFLLHLYLLKNFNPPPHREYRPGILASVDGLLVCYLPCVTQFPPPPCVSRETSSS